MLTAYYNDVPGAHLSTAKANPGWVFPCNAALPDLSLNIGNDVVTVAGEFINYYTNTDGSCFGGIQSNSGFGFTLLGDVFLKNQFVVWDFGTPQIGFSCQA